MDKRFSLLLIMFVVTLTTACKDASDNANSARSSSTFSENGVKLSSVFSASQKAVDPQTQPKQALTTEPTDCTVVSDVYRATGSCISPVQATGNSSKVNLHAQDSTIGGGTRIAGPSENGPAEGESVINFDLFNPSSFVTNNTLFIQYTERDIYDGLFVHISFYNIKFPVTFNSDTTQWVTLFLANYGQPFASSAAITNAKNSCGLSDRQAEEDRFTKMDVVPGMTFNRGDYLFCIKDNETDICSATDFQWLDETSKTLVSTRPDSPSQAHSLANIPIKCSSEMVGGENRVGFDFGEFGLSAKINSVDRFRLWSDFSHGYASQQWNTPNGPPVGDSSLEPNGEDTGWVTPYFVYYQQHCPAGICGEITSGVDMNVDFIFETKGMIFVEGMTTDEMDEETNIGNILSKIQTKDQWVFDQLSKANIIRGAGLDEGGMEVKANVSISRAINNPPEGAVVTCPGDSRC